jgi:hypothetical protein
MLNGDKAVLTLYQNTRQCLYLFRLLASLPVRTRCEDEIQLVRAQREQCNAILRVVCVQGLRSRVVQAPRELPVAVRACLGALAVRVVPRSVHAIALAIEHEHAWGGGGERRGVKGV